MKTERIEFVAPAGLKAIIQGEAAKENVSVAEVIRRRFEQSEGEKELMALTKDLLKSITEARKGLKDASAEVADLVAELQERRSRLESKAA